MTADSYRTRASSKSATLTWYWFFRRIPWKRGPVSPAAIDQVLPAGKRFERSVLTAPKTPVRLIVGKKLAIAAPTLALAATSCCSACRMSGRRSRRADGRPAGTSGTRA